jgi:hypothetical protein
MNKYLEDCPACIMPLFYIFIGFALSTLCWFLIPFLYHILLGLVFMIYIICVWVKLIL